MLAAPPTAVARPFAPAVSALYVSLARQVDTNNFPPTDFVILDLEDSVPGELKGQARAHLVEARLDDLPSQIRVLVRINSDPELMQADLASVRANGRVSGVILPKPDREALAALAQLRAAEQASARLAIWLMGEHPSFREELTGFLETCEGIEGVLVGYKDLAAALGLDLMMPTDSLFAAGKAICDAARAHGLFVLNGPIIGDRDRLQAHFERTAQDGYDGICVISPKQFDVLKEMSVAGPKDVTA